MWHALIYFTLATISSTLQLILRPFRILKWQFSLPINILQAYNRHPFWAESPCTAHYREYSPRDPGERSPPPVTLVEATYEEAIIRVK